jgi:hypothetical protein
MSDGGSPSTPTEAGGRDAARRTVGGPALVCAVAALGVSLWNARTPTTIEARSFRVVDDAGSARAELGLDAGGFPRFFMATAGVRYVEATGGPQPSLVMRDYKGADRAALRVAADPNGTEGAALVILDAAKRTSAQFGSTLDGRPSLDLYDREGRHRATIRVEVNGTPHVNLFTPDGVGGIAAATPSAGTSQLQFLDDAKRSRLVLGTRDGMESIVGADAQGAETIRVPTR